MKDSRLTVRLDPDTYQQLKVLATTNGTPTSYLVRLAVMDMLTDRKNVNALGTAPTASKATSLLT